MTIPANGSYRYKLKDEVPGNLADGWIGSIVVTGSRVSVTSDFFSWAEETVFTTNGFPASAKWDRWFVPLFFVRRNTLTGVMSTPVSVQNVSNNNATIHVNEVALICKAAQGSGYNDFTVYNPVVISPNATYSFNPVTHTTLFPTDGWYGSCRVEVVGGKQAVVLPQVRFPATRNAAFYEGIQGNGDHTRLIFPVVQKRLADGSATSLVIHNLSLTNSANVSLYYYGDDNSTECTNTSPINGGAPLLFTIAPGASLARNHRLLNSGSPEEETAMPVGWCGNLVVTSSEPVDGMLQLSNITNPPGDTFMAGMADAR